MYSYRYICINRCIWINITYILNQKQGSGWGLLQNAWSVTQKLAKDVGVNDGTCQLYYFVLLVQKYQILRLTRFSLYWYKKLAKDSTTVNIPT